jgi:hypothetical protein
MQVTTVQDNFKTEGKILLVTSRCGSVGLNLQTGSIVIQCEIWWNESSEKQAYARCYRQGQCKAIKVMRLFATNSSLDALHPHLQKEEKVYGLHRWGITLHDPRSRTYELRRSEEEDDAKTSR